MNNENTEVLYYIDGKYYTLRRQVNVGRQYYSTLVEVLEPDIEESNIEDIDNG